MDNELSVEDRRQVEDFIAQHPDLKEELDQLMQFKLEPAAIEFPGKEELWKGSTLIHPGNQAEWIMLYLDGELSLRERNLLEEYLREEPVAQEEFTRLQKIKLIPEPIVFENKELLYRREKQRRVIPVFYFRIAAALILAAIGLGLFYIFNNSARNKMVNAPLAGNKTTPVTEPAPVKNNQDIQLPPAIASNEDPLKEENKQPGPITPGQEEKTSLKKTKEEKPVHLDKEAIALNNEKEKPVKPSNNLPLPVNNPRITINDEKALAYTKPEEEIHNNGKNNNISDVTNPAIVPSDIKTAAFDPNEELEDQNGSGKKNRHRGIFRTIARTFEKRTNTDATQDDKLLVAGFRINLK
jgi:hypothetical protein